MHFKNFLLITFAAALFHADVNAQPDPYWDYMSRAVRGHPAFAAFISSKDTAASLLAIEEARRYPKIEGVFSRVDGASTLTTTPSAWQSGLSLSYPLFDNWRQDARDEIARSQGRQELASSAQSIERLVIELANAHIRMWEAAELQTIIESAMKRMLDLQSRLADQAKTGEASLLMQSKIAKMVLDLRTKSLDAQQRFDSASQLWTLAGTPPPRNLLPPTSGVTGDPSPHVTLRRLEADVGRAEGEYELARRDEGFAVNFQALALARRYSNQPGWPQYQIWQLNATYPLFDGGLSASRTQREALTLATKRAELMVEKAQTSMEQTRLRQLLAATEEIIRSMNEQCQLQSRLADDILVRFDLGRGTLTEVTEVYLASLDCSMGVVRTRADFYLKHHDLSRLNGAIASLVLDPPK